MKFTIRDLFLVTVIVALVLGWWVDHRQQAEREQEALDDAYWFAVMANGWPANDRTDREQQLLINTVICQRAPCARQKLLACLNNPCPLVQHPPQNRPSRDP